jgi:glycerophosphoryl diester phosphodiesterase
MKRFLLIVALVVVGWALVALVANLVVPPVEPHPALAHDWAVIAHGGGNHEAPDNTFAAYDNALAVGADVLEMDTHLTADGEIVVIHDDTIDRYSEASGRVDELTLAEVQSYDAAYWWPMLHGEARETRESQPESAFPYRGAGLVFPALRDVLERYPVVPMVIEMKPPNSPEIVRALGDMLREYDRADTVVVATFHEENMELFRELYPEFATAGTQAEILPFFIMSWLGFGGAYRSDAEAFQVPTTFSGIPVLTWPFVRSAKVQNIALHPWTIDDEDTMRKLFRKGVDGIMTNEPTLLRRVADEAARP